MIIGIEAQRANSPAKTGVEHYAKQLILHLAKIDLQNEYRLYLRSSPEPWLLTLPKNFSIKVMPFPLFWTQLRISWEMLLNPVDVLFIPASALPLIHPKKTVVTIHDLGWKFYPQSFTWFNRNFLEISTRFAVWRASRVIAVSQSTKNDIIKCYKVPAEKIEVVWHGYEQADTLVSEQVSQLVSGLPEKYALFLSTLQPRKNLEGLINAFRLLKNQYPEIPHKLVVVGRPGWKFKSILKKLEENKDIVIYLNYVSDQDRLEILQRASLLVQPAFYEGFGMQILEAFAAGVPVAVSKVSSMPEVAEDSALYFDPHNPQDIKNALKSIIFDVALAQDLVVKGQERLKFFSWEKCAKETLNVLTSNLIK
ncbi:MAG: glycosyltransferase family 1 protein [Candidatus Doudnabacteria bacterium]|jgi:glycosyltransferase involved in cell wall biosynthesis